MRFTAALLAVAVCVLALPLQAGPIRLVTPLDPDYQQIVERYPLLSEASVIGMRGEIPHRVHFDHVDTAKLEKFATSLLQASTGDGRTTLTRAPAKADGSTTMVDYKLHVDGIPVEGSGVGYEMRADGSASLWNTLVPIDRPKEVASPDAAVQAAREAWAGRGLSKWAKAPKIRKTYVVQDEVARLAYEVSVEHGGRSGKVVIDGETGTPVAIPESSRFNAIPSDAHWTQPPWTWQGIDPATGKVISCSLDYQSAKPTAYYALPEFLLEPLEPQANLDGPAARLRDAELGLTTVRWEKTFYGFLPNNNYWQLWSDVEPLVYSEVPPGCGPGFPAPVGAGVLKLIPPAIEEQARQLRTALLDMSERFPDWGFDSRPELVLIPDVLDTHGRSCEVHYDLIDRPYRMILCGADELSLKQGKPERIPPIEVFAHEVAHVGLHEIRARNGWGFEKKVLTEALADIMSAYVDSRHDLNYWRLADRPAFMQRVHDERCIYWSEGCNATPVPALRDLANPKTMNPLQPGATFWNGENFDQSGTFEHRNSQVISHMAYLLAEGSDAGARDDDLALGVYEAFEGIGFQPMIEIVRHTAKGYHWATASSLPAHAWTAELKLAAAQQCGLWSREEQLVGKAAWIANLADGSAMENGNMQPGSGQDVLPFTALSFVGQKNLQYQVQVARDSGFKDIVLDKSLPSDANTGNVSLAVDLDNGEEYWWRVRRTNAPIFGSPWIGSDTENLCWRIPAHFRAATVEDLVPAAGQVIEPWSARLSWTGSSVWSGYEYMVDDVESAQGPRYTKVWARGVLDAKTVVPEDPGTPQHPNHAVEVPLPSQRGLCWKVIPFSIDPKGERIDGEAVESCFHTGAPSTLIISPTANAQVRAQPLTIDYDPADGAARHAFSLEVLELAGDSAPPASGPWSYIDNADSDEGNIVKEEPHPANWTHRTRKRMLPVQLEMTPYINYAPAKVRLSVTSFSPTISSPANGGTYPELHEKTASADVVFRPAPPADFVDLHPFVTSPPATDHCSSSKDLRLFVEWNHGAAATAEIVHSYELELYSEKCNNISPVGCYPWMSENDPLFGQSLFTRRTVKHNGQASQLVEFSRNDLFPESAGEHAATGFLVNLHGVSGPEPGPAGLNITGSFLVDLPVLPAEIVPVVQFFAGGPNGAHANFKGSVETSKNSLASLRSQSQYTYPDNHIILEMYQGSHCDDPGKLITHNRDDPEDTVLMVSLSDPRFDDEALPVVSVRAFMTYGGMACKQLESWCISHTGVNVNSRPKSIEGLVVMEDSPQLGVAWNDSLDPNPDSLVYTVTLKAADDLSKNVLVQHPQPQDHAYPSLDAIGTKRGRVLVASLDPLDVGKQIVVRVRACRQGTNRCSNEATLLHQVGGGDPSALPQPAEFVEVRPDDGGSAANWEWLEPGLFDYGAITVSWEPPSSGPAPTYYLIGFSSLGSVPGVLPTWIDSLGIQGAQYPGAAEQYATVVRAAPDGMVFGDSPWATYVMPLAITNPAAAPASGTWVTANVWSCVGAVPLPPLKAFGWIMGADLGSCTGPAAHSTVTP